MTTGNTQVVIEVTDNDTDKIWLEIYNIVEDCYSECTGHIDYNKFTDAVWGLYDIRRKAIQ